MVEFQILGTLEVVDGDRSISLGGPKQRALLGALLVHRGEVLSADRLIDEVWGDHPPATAGKTLQGYVSRLRKSLGDGVLLTRAGGYVLVVEPDQVDADRFESLAAQGRTALAAGDAHGASARLCQSLELWRGSALADLAYEEFAGAEIERLEEDRLAAVEDRVEADLALGEHARMIGELEARVHEHPLRERLQAQLMLALYRCGRQADALERYQQARRRLNDELGIEPGRALRELEARILRHDPELEPPVATPSSGAGELPPARDQAASREPVIGRSEQIAQLRDGVEATFNGHGVVVMTGGEPGIGKTRLADELARAALDRGARVAWGRCWEVGGAPSYWPWVQVLRSLTHDAGEDGGSSLGEARGHSLRALISELGASPEGSRSSSPDAATARFELFDAVGMLLRQATAVQPLVIVLDDLHAADTPSLLLLQFLAGQLQDAAVMLAGFFRDEDHGRDGALSTCLAALARLQSTRRIRLAGLNDADTARVIEAITGRRVPDSVAEKIHAETEGNPLFVGEIVRLLEAEGTLERSSDQRRPGKLPDTVREVISERLRRLTPQCRRLLGEASILGREFGVREVAAVAECDEATVLDAFDEGTAARVLSDAPVLGRLRFAHVLVRDTLYEALGAAHRRDGHLRAAEILERFYAADPEPHLAELAHHFCQALPVGNPATAVDYAQRAGEHAISQLAYEEAARQYALALRALGLQPGDVAERRCALLVALGDARARGGDEPGAREVFLEGAAMASRGGWSVLHAQAALGYGGRFVWSRASGDVHLVPLLEAALQALPAEHPALRVRLMARLSGALRDHPSRERRASLSAQGVAIARELDDPETLAYALGGRYCAIMWPDTAEERLGLADEIVAVAQRVRADELAIIGRCYRAIANMELGRMPAVEAELEQIAGEATTLRQPAQLWITAASRADLALFQGRFEDAQVLIAEALRLGARAQSRDSVLSHRLQLFMLYRETGIGDELETVIADAVVRFPMRPVFRCALAYLDADQGDTGRARAAVRELGTADFGAIQRDNEYLPSLAFLADAVDILHDVHPAAVLYDLLVPFANLNASNLDEISTGSVSRSLGVLAATTSRWDDAFRHFEFAVAHNAEMGARPWAAHSQHDHARALVSRDALGDRDRASLLIEAAGDAYQTLGMTQWLTRAQQLRDAL